MHNNTILIVDDQRAIRQILEEVFLAEGMEVMLAASGLEALQLLEKRDADLILLDMTMPSMSGLEFLQEMQRNGKSFPVIIMSGQGDTDVIQEAKKMGAINCILKPFDLAEIKTAVAEVLQERRTD